MSNVELAVGCAGPVAAGVLAEIALIGAEAWQRTDLVERALAMARLVEDPESAAWAPEACAELMIVLDSLHEIVC